MRYLLISLLMLLCGCTSYPKYQNLEPVIDTKETKVYINPYFSNLDKDYVYRANISVYDHNFGGIFIVKKITNNEHRVVFTTEMGNKIFDFSYLKKDFKVNFVIEKLDKKILLNILKKDFKALITEKPEFIGLYKTDKSLIQEALIYNKKHYYFWEDNQLKKIIRAKKKKEKVMFSFSNISGNIAKAIEIRHQNVKLAIKLKRI